MSDHIHTPDDGRGPRDVYLDGKPVRRVVYANTKKGKVRVYAEPIKLDKYRKRILTRTKRGRVEVVPQSI